MNDLNKPRLIDFPKVIDPRGNLTFIEGGEHIPFDISRVYWIYDVPGGETRGGHAHKKLEQIIISVSGSFDIVLDDGKKSTKFFLNRSYYGLYIPQMVWREIENFSTGAICLCLASLPYDENEYIRDYEQFKSLSKKTD